MFNIGSGELALIAVVALLVLGPKRLPELARGIGKFMREFRRQTDEVRGVVEREFYKMDQEVSIHEPPLTVRPAQDSVHAGLEEPPLDLLPPATETVPSQLTAGQPQPDAPTPTPVAEPSPAPTDKSNS